MHNARKNCDNSEKNSHRAVALQTRENLVPFTQNDPENTLTAETIQV